MSATGTSRAEPAFARADIRIFRPPPMRGCSGTGSLRGAPGFTLIEMLVVVLLIGILATFAVLSIGSRALDDQLETEARRLHELLRLAAEEAVLQGVELGFSHTQNGYSFLYLDPETRRWATIPDDPVLRDRELGPPFFIELRVEGRLVPPADPPDDDKPLQPQVLLSSSGEVTEFSVRIRAPDHVPYFQLDGNLVGQMKLERKESPS